MSVTPKNLLCVEKGDNFAPKLPHSVATSFVKVTLTSNNLSFERIKQMKPGLSQLRNIYPQSL